ncbi:MAG: DUF1846 domain-containing protein [Candidatus Saccharibacteria bacterium]|nr:DUF1846 domain-containing protein [Candidatus Saccharibacteria bacterium]
MKRGKKVIGFDNEKYLKLQSEKILERSKKFDDKLYLEFGGKLFDDYHASRVLPGFEPDSKMRMLLEMKDEAEIILVISAGDIEHGKLRGDLGITYDTEVLRLIDTFKEFGLKVCGVCITRYTGQSSADSFKCHLESLGVKVYRHYNIENYPADVDHIISEDGFGKNDYIETSRRLVIVTAPGPGSGKMAVCLSQLYHEFKRGTRAGYAKFETFPIWNLPLKHAVNLAYEAATADLDDVNMIDPFHLDTYGEKTVNYNRDVEIFPVLNAMFERIYGDSPYKSPTDMGVNMVGNCIIDDEICRNASRQEILRRYYAAACSVLQGTGEKNEVSKLDLLIKSIGLDKSERPVITSALEKAEETSGPAVALELPDGKIITGKATPLLGAASACLLNALKTLGGVNDEITLISPEVLEPICYLKSEHLRNGSSRLHLTETLIALSICSRNDKNAIDAFSCLDLLKNCEAHSTVILSQDEIATFKKLGLNLTCEPTYNTKKLYHR